LFRVVVDDKLATATWAVEHLAVNSSLPGFVSKNVLKVMIGWSYDPQLMHKHVLKSARQRNLYRLQISTLAHSWIEWR